MNNLPPQTEAWFRRARQETGPVPPDVTPGVLRRIRDGAASARRTGWTAPLRWWPAAVLAGATAAMAVAGIMAWAAFSQESIYTWAPDLIVWRCL